MRGAMRKNMAGKGIESNEILGYDIKWGRATLRGQSLSSDLTEVFFKNRLNNVINRKVMECFLWYWRCPQILLQEKSENVASIWKQKIGPGRSGNDNQKMMFLYQTNMILNPCPATWSSWSYSASVSQPVSSFVKKGLPRVSTLQGYCKNYDNSEVIHLRLLSPVPYHTVKVS